MQSSPLRLLDPSEDASLGWSVLKKKYEYDVSVGKKEVIRYHSNSKLFRYTFDM